MRTHYPDGTPVGFWRKALDPAFMPEWWYWTAILIIGFGVGVLLGLWVVGRL